MTTFFLLMTEEQERVIISSKELLLLRVRVRVRVRVCARASAASTTGLRSEHPRLGLLHGAKYSNLPWHTPKSRDKKQYTNLISKQEAVEATYCHVVSHARMHARSLTRDY